MKKYDSHKKMDPRDLRNLVDLTNISYPVILKEEDFILSENWNYSPFAEQYGDNRRVKIMTPPKMTIRDYFCLWSDLLGFGPMWMDDNWEPAQSHIKKIYDRLQQTHNVVLSFCDIREKNLILNDGVAKIVGMDDEIWGKMRLNDFAHLFRNWVHMHMTINGTEHAQGNPGLRTIVSFGLGVQYLADEIRMDDLVLNYTKPVGSTISNLAQMCGNPVVLYNPVDLQMNTAFSKAYILDSIGSSQGLKGSCFFIEKSALNAIDKLAERSNSAKIVEITDAGEKILYPYSTDNPNSVYFGLELSNPIEINYHNMWTTTVFQVYKYYPFDEKVNDCWFDLT